jgi:hypothetical protein
MRRCQFRPRPVAGSCWPRPPSVRSRRSARHILPAVFRMNRPHQTNSDGLPLVMGDMSQRFTAV